MSPFIRDALDRRQECRGAFEEYRAAEYTKAEDWCRGSMLNGRGKQARIDAYSLFMGNRSRAYAYASEELREYWQYHARPTYAEFERQTYSIYA